MGSNLQCMLGDRNRYLDELDKLHVKFAKRNQLHLQQQAGVSFRWLVYDRRRFAKALADAVSSGEYEFAEAKLRKVQFKERDRVLYSFCLTDRIVHGVVARIISERMERRASAGLYSYRPGIRWSDAISSFADFVRVHGKMQPDPLMRGLFVIRRDVKAYTDSIPVHDNSVLWEQLDRLFPELGKTDRLHVRLANLIRNVVRPAVEQNDGRIARNDRGVPTGSPISTTLFNLYLTDLDRKLSAIPQGFYARYSDDLLFAHAQPEVARYAERMLQKCLSELGLETNPAKHQSYYFNGAGRTADSWPQAQGTTRILFLGCNIAFDGTVSLNRTKIKHLMDDLSQRTLQTFEIMKDAPTSSAGIVVCNVLNRALDPRSPVCHRYAHLLRSTVTCRRQLHQIDFRIARMVSETASGKRGSRAFRSIPYRRIRDGWGLVSLEHERNKSGRDGRKTGEAFRGYPGRVFSGRFSEHVMPFKPLEIVAGLVEGRQDRSVTP